MVCTTDLKTKKNYEVKRVKKQTPINQSKIYTAVYQIIKMYVNIKSQRLSITCCLEQSGVTWPKVHLHLQTEKMQYKNKCVACCLEQSGVS